MDCEYDNIEHDCAGTAEVRVWSDVNGKWVYGCLAATTGFPPNIAVEAL